MFRELNLEIIASWPSPNYENPVKRGPELFVITAIAFSVATVSLLARLYSRIFIRHYFGPDDGLICFAYFAAIGVTACSLIGSLSYGWDRHIWDVRLTKIEGGMRNLYTVRVFWGLATSAVRLSICCLYYRLLARVAGPTTFRTVLHVYTGFTIALAVVYFFTSLFPCNPIRAYWSLENIPGQSCDNDALLMEVNAVINTASEVVIACLPLIAVFKLQVSPQQRWSVIGLLSLNFLVAFAGCFRTYYIWRSMNAPAFDMSWWAEPHFICSEVEVYVSITCACAAPLRPFIAYLYRRSVGLPSRLPSLSGKRLSFSLSTSKCSTDQSTDSCYAAPSLPHYFDLEGLAADDGYGYRVNITGPVSKPGRFSRLRRQRNHSAVSESRQLVLATPGTRNRSGSLGQEGALDIATTTEVEVKEEYHNPKSSEEWGRAWNTKFNVPEVKDIEKAHVNKGKSQN